MTLGQLINFLESIKDQDGVSQKGFDDPHSYRGYYDELSFEPKELVSIKDMLETARFCVGETFIGYKGGEYRMDLYTPVHFATYGTSDDDGYEIELIESLTKVKYGL